MEDVFARLHSLEEKMLEHYEEIDKISVVSEGKLAVSFEELRERTIPKSDLFDLHRETKEKEQKIADLELKLASFEAENHVLQSQLAILTEKISQSESTARTQPCDLTEIQRSIAAIQQRYEGEITQLRDLVATLQKDQAATRQELANFGLLMSDTSGNTATLTVQSDPLRYVAKWLQSEVVDMSAKMKEKDEVIAQLMTENDRLNGDIAQLSEALQDCQAAIRLRTDEENGSQLSCSKDANAYIRQLESQMRDESAAFKAVKAEERVRERALRDLSSKVLKANEMLQDAFSGFAKFVEAKELPSPL